MVLENPGAAVDGGLLDWLDVKVRVTMWLFFVCWILAVYQVLDSGHTDITLREAGVTPGSLLSVRRLSPEELGRVLLCCDQLATGLACATLVKKYNED